jgi:hypothetical protein
MDGDGGDGKLTFTSLSNLESISSEHLGLFKGRSSKLSTLSDLILKEFIFCICKTKKIKKIN